jgi:hypothetical protein
MRINFKTLLQGNKVTLLIVQFSTKRFLKPYFQPFNLSGKLLFIGGFNLIALLKELNICIEK